MTTSSLPNTPSTGLRSLSFSAWEDLFGGLRKMDLWGRLGWLDIKRRYRRTLIGPFWTSVSLSLYVIAVGFVGAGLWHQDIREYLPFLTSGMVGWVLVSSMVTESCNLFVSGQALFRNVRFEYSILAYALVWRNLIVFFHNLIVYFVVAGVMRPELISFTAVLAVPDVMLIAINGAWVALLCGMFCLRYRDVTQLVASIIQISMLITPIFWPPDSLTGFHRLIFVEMNPLHHMIDIVRGPLMGRIPGVVSYVVLVSIAIGGWLLTYEVLRRFGKRITYWS